VLIFYASSPTSVSGGQARTAQKRCGYSDDPPLFLLRRARAWCTASQASLVRSWEKWRLGQRPSSPRSFPATAEAASAPRDQDWSRPLHRPRACRPPPLHGRPWPSRRSLARRQIRIIQASMARGRCGACVLARVVLHSIWLLLCLQLPASADVFLI
jgi:hypothetical protein